MTEDAALRRAVDALNGLLDSPRRPCVEQELRAAMRERASGRPADFEAAKIILPGDF